MPRVTNPAFHPESKREKPVDKGIQKFIGRSFYAAFILWLLDAFGYVSFTAGLITLPLWAGALWIALWLLLAAVVVGVGGLAVAATNGLQKRVQSV